MHQLNHSLSFQAHNCRLSLTREHHSFHSLRVSTQKSQEGGRGGWWEQSPGTASPLCGYVLTTEAL